MEATIERMEQERQERAASEEFTFVRSQDDDGRTIFHVLSHTSKQAYVVTREACSCPDFTYRSGPKGIDCKHREALLLAHRAGTLD